MAPDQTGPVATGDNNWKEFAVLIPLTASAFAITFDVGYFWALDINFFNFFSITEHLVFAMQAMPLAILGAIFFIAIMLNNSLSDHAFQLVAVRGITKKRYFRFAIRLVVFVIMLVWIWNGLYRENLAFAKAAFIYFGAFGVAFVIFPNPFFKRVVFIPILAAGIFITTFAIGMDVARSYLRNAPPDLHVVSLEQKEIIGRLIRTGDRGALIFETSSQQLRLIPWDSIQGIATKYAPQKNLFRGRFVW